VTHSPASPISGAATQQHSPCRQPVFSHRIPQASHFCRAAAPRNTAVPKISACILQVKTPRRSTALCHPKPGSQLTSCCICWLLSRPAIAFLGGKFSCPSEAGPSGCTPGSTWKASEMPASAGTASTTEHATHPEEEEALRAAPPGRATLRRKTPDLHHWRWRKANTIPQPLETCAGRPLEPSAKQPSSTTPP